MKAYKIPRKNDDLRKYALWKNLKYLVAYLLYVGFFTSAFLFFLNGRHEDAEPLSSWTYPLFAVIVLISGWVICCMYRFVGDRSVLGRIKSIKIVRNYDRGLSRTAKLSLDEHTYIRITTVEQNGKRHHVTVPLFDDGYDGYYPEGGSLIKFRGLTYPLCRESEEKGTHLCGVCGVRTYYIEGKVICGEAEPQKRGELLICRSCGHTLINLRDLREERT